MTENWSCYKVNNNIVYGALSFLCKTLIKKVSLENVPKGKIKKHIRGL